jgi:hypothetical protein
MEIRQVSELTETVLNQNCFQYNCNCYTPTKGIAMGSPLSSMVTLSPILWRANNQTLARNKRNHLLQEICRWYSNNIWSKHNWCQHNQHMNNLHQNLREQLYGIKSNIRFSAFGWLFSIRLIMHSMKIKITDGCLYMLGPYVNSLRRLHRQTFMNCK